MPKPSRETKFSGANVDREIFIFPVQLTTSRIGNLYCWRARSCRRCSIHLQRIGARDGRNARFIGFSGGCGFGEMLYLYGHTYSKSMDQPGKVASPARGRLNRKNEYSLSAFVPENLVSRDGFGSPVPRQPAHLHTQAESGAYLRDSSRVPRRRPFIHL